MGYDSMFHNGESISDFRADLSGKDDFGKLNKAFKKAYFVRGSKMDELFDYDTISGWKANGWKVSGLTGSEAYYKSFFDNKYRFRINIGGVSNFPTDGLEIRRLGSLGSHIYINYAYGSAPMAQMIFPTVKDTFAPLIQAWWRLITNP